MTLLNLHADEKWIRLRSAVSNDIHMEAVEMEISHWGLRQLAPFHHSFVFKVEHVFPDFKTILLKLPLEGKFGLMALNAEKKAGVCNSRINPVQKLKRQSISHEGSLLECEMESSFRRDERSFSETHGRCSELKSHNWGKHK